MLIMQIIMLITLIVMANVLNIIDVSSSYYSYFVLSCFVLIVFAISFVFADISDRIIFHLLGVVFAFLSLFLLRLLCAKKTKTEALGIGDVLIGTAFGMHLGIVLFCVCGMVACAAALIWIRIKGRRAAVDKGETVSASYPFAPALTAGFAVGLVTYELLMRLYFG